MLKIEISRFETSADADHLASHKPADQDLQSFSTFTLENLCTQKVQSSRGGCSQGVHK